MARDYSYSKISLFEKCPRQYKFSHIEKAVVDRPVVVEMFLGSSVHRALERLYKYKVNGRIQPEDEMLRTYHEGWEGTVRDNIKVTRDNMGVDDYIRVGADALRKYYKLYHPFDEGEILGLEKNISFPIDPNNRFIIRAKLDKILKREDGVIEIIDYKTDSLLPTQQSLDKSLQMGLYQIGVRYLWPQFEKIKLKQIYLRQGMAMSTTMDDDLLEEIGFRTKSRIFEIEQARRDDNFPAIESGLCEYCVYYELCPAKRHQLALNGAGESEFDPEAGRDIAEKFLTLNLEKKKVESELQALRDDILKFCEKADLTKLDADHGHVKVTFSETEGFPSKSEDDRTFVEISQLARQAKLDECFKLDQNMLYKDLFSKERLPEDLMKKLRGFLRRKRSAVVRTSYIADD